MNGRREKGNKVYNGQSLQYIIILKGNFTAKTPKTQRYPTTQWRFLRVPPRQLQRNS